MRKLFLSLFIAFFVFVGAGCAKNLNTTDDSSLLMKASDVQKSVQGWQVYTNPAFRYEVRYPQGWGYTDSGEDGLNVWFTPHTKLSSAIKIIGNSNWQEKYDIRQFYLNKGNGLFESQSAREEIELAGAKGFWFKDVNGRVEGESEKLVDLIVLDLTDRIMEIEIRDKEEMEQVKVLINSIKFYPNNPMMAE